jgi:OTU domain-containing protein 6
MEELKACHRKEQRELHARITQKKKNATKKTRKGVNDECDVLQRYLDERQQNEIAALHHEHISNGVADLDITGESQELEQNRRGLDVNRTPGHGEGSTENRNEDVVPRGTSNSQQLAADAPAEGRSKKPNRQKARLARRAAEQETLVAEAAAQAANLPDLRQQELDAMQEQLDRRSLREISIRPDGHCLYSAIAMQLPAGKDGVEAIGPTPAEKPYQQVRNQAANFMLKHPDDFAAFLEEPLGDYVHKIKTTTEWGGQLELQAAARAYRVNINVLQADGRVEKIESGCGDNNNPLWLAYYRHSFGLGEHYNALKKI